MFQHVYAALQCRDGDMWGLAELGRPTLHWADSDTTGHSGIDQPEEPRDEWSRGQASEPARVDRDLQLRRAGSGREPPAARHGVPDWELDSDVKPSPL